MTTGRSAPLEKGHRRDRHAWEGCLPRSSSVTACRLSNISPNLGKTSKPALRYNPSWMKHTFLRSVVSFLNSHYLWKGLELFWNACLISFHDLPIKKPLSLDSGSNCLRQSKPLQRNVLHGKIHQLRLLVPIQARVIISKCVRFCLPYQPWNIRNQHKNTSIARSHTEAFMKSCCKEQIFHWTSPVIHTSLFLPSN